MSLARLSFQHLAVNFGVIDLITTQCNKWDLLRDYPDITIAETIITKT